MLSRWQNIHLLLKNKYADKYASIAPYLIREEYICTILKTQKANIIPNRRYSEILVKTLVSQRTPLSAILPCCPKHGRETSSRLNKTRRISAAFSQKQMTTPKTSNFICLTEFLYSHTKKQVQNQKFAFSTSSLS